MFQAPEGARFAPPPPLSLSLSLSVSSSFLRVIKATTSYTEQKKWKQGCAVIGNRARNL